jgi:anhydro-N-acetylmuramic acid kinase
LNDVVAFDTGPGNMIIDGLMQELYHRPFDGSGAVASSGKILPALLRWLNHHPYLAARPPKSTGREHFGEEFREKILRHSIGERKQDIVATVTEFTALSIYQQYAAFIRRKTRIDELLVSGGGVHNDYLMDSLTRYFDRARVIRLDEPGLSPDAKEAVCFAVLANETIAGNPSNVPGATGARRPAILGAICVP